MPKSKKESEDASINDRHGMLCLRLCQAMILVGEQIASQREFLKRAKVSRSNAFNVIRAETRPPSARTMSKLAACCMSESWVPWTNEVSTTIAESLLPALRSPSAWRDWREKNLALTAFADSISAPHPGNLDHETVAGGAVVRWFVALGDYCDVNHQSTTKYREACDRLVTVLGDTESRGSFAQWLRFHALQDQYALKWNSLTDDERASPTKEDFEGFFRMLCDYIEAGHPTLVGEHVNALVFASRFDMVDAFPLLKDRLERAWRRHNGGESPNYASSPFDDSDFKVFRKWLQDSSPKERLQVCRAMPTSIPSQADQSEYRFVAVESDGYEWVWNDDEMVWLPRDS